MRLLAQRWQQLRQAGQASCHGQVDANVVLIDRDFDVSMKRLQARLAALPPPRTLRHCTPLQDPQPGPVRLLSFASSLYFFKR